MRTGYVCPNPYYILIRKIISRLREEADLTHLILKKNPSKIEARPSLNDQTREGEKRIIN